MKKAKVDKNSYVFWAQEHLLGIFVMNLVLMLLLLLYTAGYFHPFFPLTINVIVFVALILAVFLIGIRSKGVFATSLFFIILATFLRAVHVDIWAERSAIYAFEAMIVGIVIYIFQNEE